MTHLALEYFLVVFVASCGVLQLVAAHSRLKGLLFFNKVTVSYVLATLAIGGALGWFFGWDNRLEAEMMQTGLEGVQQFLYFTLAAFSALAFTLVVSSLTKRKGLLPPQQKDTEQGLDALRGMSYFEAIRHSLGIKKGEDNKGGCSG
jgi:hypothetical protein